MNRKLLNGLLVVAFAAGGVVTFTSCKDEDYLNKLEWEEAQEEAAEVERVSSIGLAETYNPMFGTISTPFGLKSYLLATYYVDGADATGYNFPAQAESKLNPDSPLGGTNNDDMGDMEVFDAISTLMANGVTIKSGAFTTASTSFGNFGAIYASVNPLTANLTAQDENKANIYNVKLVDATGASIPVTLTATANQDKLAFGRATTPTTNVYKIQANGTSQVNYLDMDKISDYKDEIESVWEQKSLSNLAAVGALVYDKLNNRFPMYALQVNWTEGEDANAIVNCATSDYDLAVATVHPLSFTTFEGQSIGTSRLPEIGPLNEILNNIKNKLDLTWTDVDGVKDLTLNVTYENGKFVVTYVNAAGETISKEFDYANTQIDAEGEDVADFVNDIMGQENEMLADALNKAIMDINSQLSTYVARVDNFFEWIQDRKEYDYASKFIDKYTEVAKKVNDFLNNPNHYFQVAAIYSDPQSHYHRLSGVYDDPTPVMVESGDDIIELLLSTYTGELVVPCYYKYVAITQVNGVNVTSDQGLNELLPGQDHRVSVPVGKLNPGTYTITYVAVDYHGSASAQNYYIKVMK